MKTITVSDEDYDILMELSKELQTQPNHHQAFPYFWEPASEKLYTNPHNEGEISKVYDGSTGESYTPEEYAECNPELYEAFLMEIITNANINESGYTRELESEWVQYIICNKTAESYSGNWKQKTEHNPSLFLSDVQGFIESNKHHLGKNPHTFARSVWRMPKMEALVGAIYRLNKQPIETVNKEASRFVFKK